MAILFRCPCGRSMVADAGRAGTLIHCPSCHRTLRVPSGKERGKELAPVPAEAMAHSTRPCDRCGASVPVDTQICPHCRTILSASPSAAGTGSAAPAGGAEIRSATAVLYGVSRATWWSCLSSGAKAGILGGLAGFLILVGVSSALLHSSWSANQTVQARDQAARALAQGPELEVQGKFQQAYDLYFPALARAERFLKAGGRQDDRRLYDGLSERLSALRCIVPEPRVREPVRWRPANQAEFDAAAQQLVAEYPAYRQRILAVADAAIAAIQNARANNNQTAYAQEVRQVVDAFIRFTNQTTPPQRAQYTYEMLTQAMRELTSANGEWETGRKTYLAQSEARLKAIKDLAQQRPGTLDGDKIM